MSVRNWYLLEDMEDLVDPLAVPPILSSQIEYFVTASYFFLNKETFTII